MKRHGDSDSGRRRVRRAGARPAAAARASTQPRGRRPLACPFRWTLLTHTIGERIVAAVICADSLAVLAVHVGDRHTLTSLNDLRLAAEVAARGFVQKARDDTIPVVPTWVPPTAASEHVFSRLLASLQSHVLAAASLNPVPGRPSFYAGIGAGATTPAASKLADPSAAELKRALDDIQNAWNKSPYTALRFSWPAELRARAQQALWAATTTAAAAAAAGGAPVGGFLASPPPGGAAPTPMAASHPHSAGGGAFCDDAMGGSGGGGSSHSAPPASSTSPAAASNIRWDQLSALITSKVGIGASATVVPSTAGAAAASASSGSLLQQAGGPQQPSPGGSTVRGPSPLEVARGDHSGSGAGLFADTDSGADDEDDDDSDLDGPPHQQPQLTSPVLPEDSWSPMYCLSMRLGGLHATVEAGAELDALQARAAAEAAAPLLSVSGAPHAVGLSLPTLGVSGGGAAGFASAAPSPFGGGGGVSALASGASTPHPFMTAAPSVQSLHSRAGSTAPEPHGGGGFGMPPVPHGPSPFASTAAGSAVLQHASGAPSPTPFAPFGFQPPQQQPPAPAGYFGAAAAAAAGPVAGAGSVEPVAPAAVEHRLAPLVDGGGARAVGDEAMDHHHLHGDEMNVSSSSSSTSGASTSSTISGAWREAAPAAATPAPAVVAGGGFYRAPFPGGPGSAFLPLTMAQPQAHVAAHPAAAAPTAAVMGAKW